MGIIGKRGTVIMKITTIFYFPILAYGRLWAGLGDLIQIGH
jgi:hypothetical protein